MGWAGLMSATELEEVQALLERVLPDPAGYAQRLLLQVMTQFGPGAEPSAGPFYPGAGVFYSATTDQDVTANEMVITPDQPTVHEMPADTNILLAAALGACECWGLRGDCDLCRGLGSAGWTEPVPELFEEFVAPAIAKLSETPGGGHQEHDGMKAYEEMKADEERDNHQAGQGENA